MSMRFQKRIKLAKGVSINLNKKSIGLSVGVPGARVSTNTRGQVTSSVGLPGTGLSYQKTYKAKKPITTENPYLSSSESISSYDLDLDEEENFSKAKFCMRCGKKRGLLEDFNKRGFCFPCNTKLRKTIENGLSSIKTILTVCHPQKNATQEDYQGAAALIESALKTIDELEQLRKSAPFFKSSTSESAETLREYQAFYAQKLNENAANP